ncbi:hypothetical protein DL546_003986 [Coniochaeta pulveracea]|nr:hypothetical protein DL546_003986 [Coniochaeta pulveracea]
MNENDPGRSEYVAYSHMCRDNLETGLANLPLFMPLRMESVEALLLGAGYAIEASKPSMAWQMTCAACQLCMAMGYHRLSPFSTADVSHSQPATPSSTDPLAEKKRGLFWFAYMLDKGLALRFGRSSILQDYDIALPKTLPTTINTIGGIQAPGPTADPWRAALELWITHAEVQGQIYEHLYSASALNSSAESRLESARMLVAKQNGLVEQLAALQRQVASHNADVNNDTAVDRSQDSTIALASLGMLLKSDEVSHCSSLALIYRAIPPSDSGRPSKFNDECIKAARAAFAAHEECMSLTSPSQFLMMAYLHWTILYAPFVPFVVLFCHVIATSNQDDLKRLGNFVAGLEPTRSASRAIDKLYRLCRIMYDVATMYVEAKEREKTTLDADMVPVENDFNLYLSQLGLIPPHVPGWNPGIGTGSLEGGGMTEASYQATQLGDWFEGNSYMMGLMEEDLETLSQFPHEPGAWPS